MQGYTGANCTTQCPYPSYGDACQGTCNCSIDICDMSWGCRTLTTLTTSYKAINCFEKKICHLCGKCY